MTWITQALTNRHHHVWRVNRGLIVGSGGGGGGATFSSTLLDRDTLPVTLMGHDFYVGYAAFPVDGPAVTMNSGETEFTVTNTNTSGSGSLSDALDDADTAGGGRIRIQVNGTLEQNSELRMPPNTVIDGRGFDFTLSKTSGSHVILNFDNDATNNVLIGFSIIDDFFKETNDSSDNIRQFGSNSNIPGKNGFAAFLTLLGQAETDGLWDMTRPESPGYSWTRCWIRWGDEGVISEGEDRRAGIHGDGTGDHDDLHFVSDHHMYFDRRQRMILNHGTHHTWNVYRQWSLAGEAMRNDARFHSNEDTFDATDAPLQSDPNNRKDGGVIDNGIVGSGGDIGWSINNPRQLNGSTLTGESSGLGGNLIGGESVAAPSTIDANYSPCAANSSHDTILLNFTGHSAMVTMGGDIDNGLTFTLPSNRSWPAGTSWFASGLNIVLDGSPTITRTSATVMTLEFDNQAWEDGDQVWWMGQDSSGTYVCTWNPATITED